MKCTNPRSIWVKQKDGRSKLMAVPCGQCMACRVQRTEEWAIRIMLESDYHEYNSFVTLTYDNDHILADQSLHKKELQDYVKRLRSYLPVDLRIKYYGCGEYGDEFGRPHYHIIIFGLASKDPAIKKAWSNGFVTSETLTFNRARYVAGYVQKKLTGKRASEYGKKVAPFSLMSKGLAKEWMQDNEKYIEQNLGLTIKGVKHAIPRYFKKNLDVAEELQERAQELIKKECKHLGIDPKGVNYIINDKENKQRDQNLKAKLNLKRGKL